MKNAKIVSKIVSKIISKININLLNEIYFFVFLCFFVLEEGKHKTH
jgi:hypothetical protein